MQYPDYRYQTFKKMLFSNTQIKLNIWVRIYRRNDKYCNNDKYLMCEKGENALDSEYRDQGDLDSGSQIWNMYRSVID